MKLTLLMTLRRPLLPVFSSHLLIFLYPCLIACLLIFFLPSFLPSLLPSFLHSFLSPFLSPFLSSRGVHFIFEPKPNTFSAFKLAAVVSTIAIILVIGIAVSQRGAVDERSQAEKTDPFYVNKLSKMMMPNGWVRLRAATTASSKYTTPTGYIFLSQYEYGGDTCDENSLQVKTLMYLSRFECVLISTNVIVLLSPIQI